MNIAYNGRFVADIEMRSVSGQLGIGFHRLFFRVDINTFAWQDEVAVFREICGQVRLRTQEAKELLLGTAYPEKSLLVRTRSTAIRSQAVFYIDLGAAQIEIIENLRRGGDLWFALIISGVVDVDGHHDPHEVTNRLHVELHVNQKTWIDVLKQMEYGQFMLFEIPVPSPEASKELGQALTYLEKAREHFWRGHYDEAVANCRKTLEELTNGLGDKTELEKSKQSYLNRELREGMSIESRFLFLREVARHITHPAAHAGQSTNGPAFDRKDATFVISATAIILSRYLMRTIS